MNLEEKHVSKFIFNLLNLKNIEETKFFESKEGSSDSERNLRESSMGRVQFRLQC